MTPRIILVTDPRYGLDLTARVVRWAAAALGPQRLLVQLRDKQGGEAARTVAARALRDVTREVRALLVINGDTALAHAVGADGVHLPSTKHGDDEPLASRVAEARARLGDGAFVTAATMAESLIRTP